MAQEKMNVPGGGVLKRGEMEEILSGELKGTSGGTDPDYKAEEERFVEKGNNKSWDTGKGTNLGHLRSIDRKNLKKDNV